MIHNWIEKRKKEKAEFDNLSYYQKRIISCFDSYFGITYIFTFVLGILLGWVAK